MPEGLCSDNELGQVMHYSSRICESSYSTLTRCALGQKVALVFKSEVTKSPSPRHTPSHTTGGPPTYLFPAYSLHTTHNDLPQDVSRLLVCGCMSARMSLFLQQAGSACLNHTYKLPYLLD